MMAGDAGGRRCPDSELLLHPELLSREFLLLTLEQVGAGAAGRGALAGTVHAGRLVSPRPRPKGDVLARQGFLGVRTYFFGFRMARQGESEATLAACNEPGRGTGRVVGGGRGTWSGAGSPGNGPAPHAPRGHRGGRGVRGLVAGPDRDCGEGCRREESPRL